MKLNLTNQIKQPLIKNEKIPQNVQEILLKKRDGIPLNAIEKLIFMAWKQKRVVELEGGDPRDIAYDINGNEITEF